MNLSIQVYPNPGETPEQFIESVAESLNQTRVISRYTLEVRDLQAANPTQLIRTAEWSSLILWRRGD